MFVDYVENNYGPEYFYQQRELIQAELSRQRPSGIE
jgi:hypothetical protein